MSTKLIIMDIPPVSILFCLLFPIFFVKMSLIMKHKKLFITFTAIFSVIVIIAVFLMIWFWGDTYKSGKKYDGFEDFRAEVEIPGLKDGACPQGLGTYRATYTLKDGNGDPVLDDAGKEKTDEQDYFFISAYFDNAPSRIYVVGKKTGTVGYVTVKNVDGSDYTGHCGGVATNGYTFWVVSDTTVYVAKKSNSTSSNNVATDIIKAAEVNGELQFTASFNANLNAAFCYYYDYDGDPTSVSTSYDKFYVGEFYREKNFKTDDKHHILTPYGDMNRAFVYEFNVSTASNNKYGLTTLSAENLPDENKVPRIQNIYSVTNEIQGFARTRGAEAEEGGLVLSQSYGLKNSHLLYYSWTEIKKTSNRKPYKDLVISDEKGQPILNDDGNQVTYGGFTYEGITTKSGAQYRDTSSSLYVYYVDGASKLNDYSIPSMSEGLCVVDDRVYVLFESGAKKYRTFVRQILDEVYSFIPRSKS